MKRCRRMPKITFAKSSEEIFVKCGGNRIFGRLGWQKNNVVLVKVLKINPHSIGIKVYMNF
jgi:hypothetical protein